MCVRIVPGHIALCEKGRGGASPGLQALTLQRTCLEAVVNIGDAEPTEAMRRRLVEHGRSRWTQEQCDSMTRKQLNEHLEELGLKRRQTLTLSMEDYSPDLSWEECLEIKAADEKAAAAAAADTPQPCLLYTSPSPRD